MIDNIVNLRESLLQVRSGVQNRAVHAEHSGFIEVSSSPSRGSGRLLQLHVRVAAGSKQGSGVLEVDRHEAVKLVKAVVVQLHLTKEELQ